MKLSLVAKIFISLSLFAVLLTTLVYFAPLHTENDSSAGRYCLFEALTRAECSEAVGSLQSASHHLGALSGVFTAISVDANLLLTLALLAFAVVLFVNWTINDLKLRAQTMTKQKWREREALEKIFNPIKAALAAGILQRKEPSLILA